MGKHVHWSETPYGARFMGEWRLFLGRPRYGKHGAP